MEGRPTDNNELEELIERALGEIVKRDSPDLSARMLAGLSVESDRRRSQIAPAFARLAIVGLLLVTAFGAWLVLRPRPLETVPEPAVVGQSVDGTKASSPPPETENFAQSTPAREFSPERATPTVTRESSDRARSRVLSRESRIDTTVAHRPEGTSLTTASELLPARDIADDRDEPIAVEALAIPELTSTEMQIEVVDIAPLVIAWIPLSPLDAEWPR